MTLPFLALPLTPALRAHVGPEGRLITPKSLSGGLLHLAQDTEKHLHSLVGDFLLPRWKMGLSENVGSIPNEIAIFHRDNDQQNHWVQWGTLFSDTPKY